MLIVGHDAKKIEHLKRKLRKSFAINDLGLAKQMLGIRITHDRKNINLWLSQERYIEKVLEIFNMSKSKLVYSPLTSHFKLSSEQCPRKTRKEKKRNYNAFTVYNLMYAMICIKLDIIYVVSVVNRFLSNHNNEYYIAIK